MINNHVLNINHIQLDNTVNFTINNGSKEYNILIDDTWKPHINVLMIL